MKLRGGVGGLTLRQFANDWMTVDGPNFTNHVVSPDLVQLDQPEEFHRLAEDRRAFNEGTSHTGQFWVEWQLNEDGTFTHR